MSVLSAPEGATTCRVATVAAGRERTRARVSLVISTVNRTAELTRLLDSLIKQEAKDFEIVFVDQNSDSRIVPVLKHYQCELSIARIATRTRHGVSSGKNDGWRQSRGEIVVFPDDDCWYPPWFLRKGVELLDTTASELVSGRIADETGRSINGRFSSRAQFINRRSVWVTQSEFATFYRRELLERLGGFDEELGIGSPSPWQAAEGPDFVLKALDRRSSCYYDPSLYAFHREYDLDDPSNGMPAKGRGYARGMGYVLRRHGFGLFSLIYWASRPLVSAFISAISGKFHRVSYSLLVSLGRVEGWFGRSLTIEKRADLKNGGPGRMFAGTPPGCSSSDHTVGSTARLGGSDEN